MNSSPKNENSDIYYDLHIILNQRLAVFCGAQKMFLAPLTHYMAKNRWNICTVVLSLKCVFSTGLVALHMMSLLNFSQIKRAACKATRALITISL